MKKLWTVFFSSKYLSRFKEIEKSLLIWHEVTWIIRILFFWKKQKGNYGKQIKILDYNCTNELFLAKYQKIHTIYFWCSLWHHFLCLKDWDFRTMESENFSISCMHFTINLTNNVSHIIIFCLFPPVQKVLYIIWKHWKQFKNFVTSQMPFESHMFKKV